jgi:hypothetical protein
MNYVSNKAFIHIFAIINNGEPFISFFKIGNRMIVLKFKMATPKFLLNLTSFLL